MKMIFGNPFLDAFKYTIAITAGATVAGGLAAGGFKLAKKASKAITGKSDETEEGTPPVEEESVEELVLSDDEDDPEAESEAEDEPLVLNDD